MTKTCNDCKWVGSGWFLFSPLHRLCKHPLVIKKYQELRPADNGKPQVGIERTFDFQTACGPEGRLWNTNSRGETKS